MNGFLVTYIVAHILVLIVLVLNIVSSNRKLAKLQVTKTLKNDVWMRSCMRARHFYIQSYFTFGFAFIGECFSFWLLWMAGVFEKL